MYATGVDWYYCTIAYVLVDATPFKKALSITVARHHRISPSPLVCTTPKHRSVDMVLMKHVQHSIHSHLCSVFD
jgi:hypothetical protein